MKHLAYIMTLFAFFGCESFSKFAPEKYFSRGAELSMAENIYYGNKSEIKEMINNGRVDINTSGKAGFTFLMYAVYIEQYDVAKVLLENGADPNILSIVTHPDGAVERLTPLSCVCAHHWYPIKYIKLLVENGANINDTITAPFIRCITYSIKDQKKVRYMIEHGANINIVIGDFSPMQHAVLSGRLDLVDLLWDYGADPLYVGEKGTSLAIMLQNIVDNKLGTPEYIDHAQEIMKRLEKLGVKFPITMTPPEK